MNTYAAACRTLTLVALTIAAACSPGYPFLEADGPDFTLDAETPLAAFEVTLCMDGPETDTILANAAVVAEYTTSGTPVQVRAQNLDHPEEMDPPLDYEDAGEKGTEGAVRAYLDTDSGEWSGRSGRRCQEPQTIQFELEPSDDGLPVDVSWVVQFEVTEANDRDGRRGGDTLDDSNLVIEIEAL